MNAVDMVNRCFRRQTPEAFADVPAVPEPSVPEALRWGPGSGELRIEGGVIGEEPMGQLEGYEWGEGYEG